MADEPSLIQYGKFIVEGILAISTVTLGVLGYKQNNKVKGLEEEKEYFKAAGLTFAGIALCE